ncbi:phosphoglycerate mutase family protein [Talaromyces proteolyticus]|uniref:Phosphoglycerate mutase family protein n=1 Tax=Talaromyces proteolyticus TaxID=1131652 RepID=A0AAD4Q1S8_9EURO|nr:phosphoglycerate mutase family protein [Talaromyces proteolyticus]KAH8705970.1 phosphoglycerate mutase family protein [Talaromyces proteolyticus]
MKIFLIRHAETVDNVGQAWAGTTDSSLTNHGVLQIQRLAQYFVAMHANFTHVFSSDLKRAVATAEGIVSPNQGAGPSLLPVTTPLLQEQHFGSREGSSFRRGSNNTSVRPSEPAKTVAVETESSMRARAYAFLSEYLLPVIFDGSGDVAIVAHGMILRVLWGCLAQLFSPADVRLAPEVEAARSQGLFPMWSNTGFMEVSVLAQPLLPASVGRGNTYPLAGWSMTVLSHDSKPHLDDLRRTRGGIGSMQHDETQQRIDSFFGPRA